MGVKKCPWLNHDTRCCGVVRLDVKTRLSFYRFPEVLPAALFPGHRSDARCAARSQIVEMPSRIHGSVQHALNDDLRVVESVEDDVLLREL